MPAFVSVSTHRFGFVPVKILDWEVREEELRADENPVAFFVLAQLAALRSKKDPERRMGAKRDRWYQNHG